MESFEKLGVFYLGKVRAPGTGELTQEYLLYDSKDLVTHAVCVGMTGSGKTGLCVSLLEEAAIDGIPAIIIDPKGDLGNLLLTFPKLGAEDFRPWIDEEEARKKGVSPDEFARAEAERWRNGLAEWGEDGDRIERLRNSADFVVYTPGSTAGVPVSIASSFAAPPPQYNTDREFLTERIAATTSGLLGLLGIQADPLRSREHILISKIFEQVWTSGKDLDLASLIQMIQSPPVQRIGVFDVESFYPAAQRMELAMMLNNLLAAPGFGLWLEGEPLDVGRMLHGAQGKPRMSIFHIAHLSDAERMFFVTLLLNQTLAWMRSQPGTTSLRALLYMDEVFGYLPPVAEPPSKRPLLTLFKQARAYGLGLVLATQNPVDLDYKGLANAGTWFVGRLQTERDRERLIDGLGSSGGTAEAIDRQRLLDLIANLKPRTFLLQNAHEDHPVVFSSRWALSYLPGPLTRDQIRRLTAPSARPASLVGADLAQAIEPPVAPPQVRPDILNQAPAIPGDVRQYFLRPAEEAQAAGKIVYEPSLFASAQVQLVNNKIGFTSTRILRHALELKANMTDAPWDQAAAISDTMESAGRQPVAGAAFLAVPTTMFQGSRLQRAQKGYIDFAQREAQLVLWKSSQFKVMSQPGESERDFRIRLQQSGRERRDFELNRLRQKYATKIDALKRRLMAAEQRLAREEESYGQQKVQTAISVGATLLGALMGRKAISSATLGRATTAARQASRISREQDDVQRAAEEKTAVEQQIKELEQQLSAEADQLAGAFDPQSEVLQQVVIRATKADILIQDFGILWIPSRQTG
jgi:hypothetical protein